MGLQINDDERRRMIAEAAYFRAERRGFNGGDPVADWVEAEAEVDSELRHKEHGELVARLEQRVAEARKKVDALRKKAQAVESGAKAELQQELDRIVRLRDELVERSEEIRAQGLRASRTVREQAEALWHELSDVLARKMPRKQAARKK